MHSHLLYGIDDGAKTLEESVELIRELYSLGYKKFICTPHIMGDYYRNSKENIFPVLDKLRNAIISENIDVEVNAAAEYYIDEWFQEKLKNKEDLLTLSTNYVLVETSYLNPPSNLKEVLFDLQVLGYKVVLAHPERYTYLFQSFELYQELHELGVFFQINLTSLAGYYGKASKKIAERLIKNQMVDFVGTDCHGARHIDALKRSMKQKSFGQLAQLDLKNDALFA